MNKEIVEITQFDKFRKIFENLRKSLSTSDSSAYDMLETTLTESIKTTNCDGGTLYLKKISFTENLIKPFEIEGEYLSFEILQNLTLNVHQRSDKDEIKIPPVPLVVNNKENDKNVSAYCFNNNTVINVEDVYDNKQFDFSGAKKYDQQFNYRSKSMLVFPLKGRTHENIGVFQLINKKDKFGNLSQFTKEDEELMVFISLIMGMIFSTQNLYLENIYLLDSLIKMIAKNIEDKSPHTSEHIQRVTIFSEMIANAVTENKEGIYENIEFGLDEMEEIRKAGLLHDIGKIVIPEHFVSKEVKLQKITDRMELITESYNSLYKDIEMDEMKRRNSELEEKLKIADESSFIQYKEKTEKMETTLSEKKDELFRELITIHRSNFGGEFLHENTRKLLKNAFDKKYKTCFDYTTKNDREKVDHIFLLTNPTSKDIFSDDDKTNLSIVRGTLNDKEREKIQQHAQQSWDLLLSLHLPTYLRGIPLLAGSHHETLDGTGYPKKLTWKEMSVKMRIIAIADLIEALSSKSRPYRSPFKVTEFMKILGEMVKQGKIDGEILSIFIFSPYFSKFVNDYLTPAQKDEFNPQTWKENFYIEPKVYEGEENIKI